LVVLAARYELQTKHDDFFERLKTLMEHRPDGLADFDISTVLATVIHYAFAENDASPQRIRDLLTEVLDALSDRASPLAETYAEAVKPINEMFRLMSRGAKPRLVHMAEREAQR
jgi:hypothetical protein